MGFEFKGARELGARFDSFPEAVHRRLAERIQQFIVELQARSRAAAPFKSGQLRSEITSTVYADNPNRVAGYVEVYAPGVKDGYAKAAALEYGVSKARRAPERPSARLTRPNRAIASRASSPVQMRAFRYLRDPFAELRPEVEAAIAEALAEAAAGGA